MRIQILTRALMKGMGLAAVAIASSLISLPVLAGGATSDSMPKPTFAPTVDANPKTAPAVAVPSGNPATGSYQLTAPTGTTPASTSSEPATPASGANPTPGANPGEASSTTTTQGTIVEVATSKGAFTTLLAAIKASGLTEVLAGEGPFTVFAPTDAAFAALPKGTVEALLRPENKEKLRKVLAYHVLAGSVNSADIKSGQVKTVEGSSVILKTSGGKITVNNARVTDANIQASNGMIHAIDKVILPPDL